MDTFFINREITEYIERRANKELQKQLTDSPKKQVYAAIIKPLLYLSVTGCVVEGGAESEGAAAAASAGGAGFTVSYPDGKTSIPSLDTPLKNGGRIVSLHMLDNIVGHIQTQQSAQEISTIPGDTNILVTDASRPPNRVIVVLPILPETVGLNTVLLNTVIDAVKDSIGASVILCEVEPGEHFRDQTRVALALGKGIQIARNEFHKIRDSSVQTVIIPNVNTVLGNFGFEDTKQMLYDTAINRQRTSAWLASSNSADIHELLSLAGYAYSQRNSTIHSVTDTLITNGVPVLVARLRVAGGNEYPNGKYALYPKTKDPEFKKFGDSADKTKSKEFSKVAKTFKGQLPYNVPCHSLFYRTAILSTVYRVIRNAYNKANKGSENIKSAQNRFRDLINIDTASVCGDALRDVDIPNVVTNTDLQPSTEGNTGFAKNLGYIVTTDGREKFVVIAEDPVNGVSVIVPNGHSLVHDYRIYPSSYLYRYKSETRNVILPGTGAEEYLGIWEHKEKSRKRLPVLLERCVFEDSHGYPSWKSYDGEWLLTYKTIKGWVIDRRTGARAYQKDTATSPGRITGSWCGKYGTFMVSPIVQNPLVAIAGLIVQGMKNTVVPAFRRAAKETKDGALTPGTAEGLVSYFTNDRRFDMPIRRLTAIHRRGAVTQFKTGVVGVNDKGVTEVEALVSRSNTPSFITDFTKQILSKLEVLYCQRMMVFATYPFKKRETRYSSFLRFLRTKFTFPAVCVPSVASTVAADVFRSPRPRTSGELRYAVDAPIMPFLTANMQKNRMAGYLNSSTNPAYGHMNQFVTFAANETQLLDMAVTPWVHAGPPSYKPVTGRSTSNPLRKAIYSNIRELSELKMYQGITAIDVMNGLRYAFHRLRVSLFVSIRRNAMVVFAPMVKAEYSNYYPRTDEFWFGSLSQKDYLNAKNHYLRAIGKRPETYEPRGRWFANNSLVGNMISKNLTSDHVFPVVLEMLREVVMHEKLNDCDFLINTRDFPKLRKDGKDPDHAIYGLPPDKSVDMPGFEHSRHIPVLGFNVHPAYADIPIPVPDDWRNVYGGWYGKDTRGSSNPIVPHPLPITDEQWARREPKAVFRGSATGIASVAPMNQRVLLHEMVAEGRDGLNPDDYDVALVSAAIRDKKISDEGMQYIVPSGSPAGTVNTSASIDDTKRLGLRSDLTQITSKGRKTYGAPDAYVAQDRYQMVLYVDGNAAAYRYSSLMAAGFVILRVASRVGYSMWFYPGLTNALDLDTGTFNPKGDHILIDPDMKNLQSAVDWVKGHQKEAKQIAENSLTLYGTLFTKPALRDALAVAINFASLGQTWTTPVTGDMKRAVSEPRDAKAYRLALQFTERRQKDHKAVLDKITAATGGEGEDDESAVVTHTGMAIQDAPDTVYTRATQSGQPMMNRTKFYAGIPIRASVEETDTSASFKPVSVTRVLSKRTHGALRNQIMKFADASTGEDEV